VTSDWASRALDENREAEQSRTAAYDRPNSSSAEVPRVRNRIAVHQRADAAGND